MHGERITEPQALGLGNGKRDAVLKLQWYGRDEIVNNLLTPEEAAAGNVALYEQGPQCDVCEASRKRDISFIYDEAKALVAHGEGETKRLTSNNPRVGPMMLMRSTELCMPMKVSQRGTRSQVNGWRD